MKLFIVLLFGVAANAAVSALLALRLGDIGSIERQTSLTLINDDMGNAVTYGLFATDFGVQMLDIHMNTGGVIYGNPTIDTVYGRSAVAALLPAWMKRNDLIVGALESKRCNWSLFIHGTGWPLRSHYYAIRYNNSQSPVTMNVSGGFVISNSGDAPAIVPLRPIWRGVFVNSTVYGFLVAMIVVIMTSMRRYYRFRRGRCAQCGYDMRGNTGRKCSECGWCCK